MSIFKMSSKLLPRIDRSAIIDDLRITEKECSNVVIPSYRAAEEFFKLNKPESPDFNDFTMVFYRNFDRRGISKAPNVVTEINRRLPWLLDNIKELQAAVNAVLAKDVIAEGLTAKSAFLVRASANASMITRYMLALLNYLYTKEAEHYGRTLEPGLEIAKAEMKYVEANFVRFAHLFGSYAIPPREFKNMYLKVPTMFLNKDSQQVSAATDPSFDPLYASGISGFIGNPIYRVRMLIAKWQNDRYESTKAKKQQLELRLLYLQMQRDDGTDPVLAKEIERLQARIENYDRYLREVEESVAED